MGKANLFTRLLAALFALLIGLQLDAAPVGLRLAQASAGIVSAPFNPANSTPGVYNFNPTSLMKWRKAKQNARLGIARSRLVFAGDSTTFSQYGASFANARAKSIPTRVAQLLAARGVPTSTQSAFGGGSSFTNAAAVVAADPRLVAGAGWSVDTGNPMPGGAVFANSADTTSVTFTPTVNVNTFLAFYPRNTTLGTFSWAVDGGAATNVSEAGAAGYLSQTISAGSSASHTLGIARVSGQVWNAGILAYDSAVPAIDVINLGWPGSTAAAQASVAAAYSPLNGLGVLAPDLTIINLGINDWVISGPANAAWSTDMQSIITKAKLTGDVILVVPIPTSTATVSQAIQETYRTALYALAATNNVPLLDMTLLWGSWAAANANGFCYDDKHATELGYGDVAEQVAGVLLAA